MFTIGTMSMPNQSGLPNHSGLPNYSGLYGGLAVVTVALTGDQFYADIHDDGLTVTYLSMWQMLVSARGAGIGFLCVILLGSLVTLCATAVVRGVRSIAQPIGVAVVAIIALAMLLGRVGTSRDPDLSTTGTMLVMVGFAAVLLGIVHTIHLGLRKMGGTL